MSGEPPSPGALEAIAVEVCELAGALLLERFERSARAEVSTKTTPTDLVSEADRAAESAIAKRLSELRPEDGFLGEEGEAAAPGQSGLRWVVDPLDGTVNFLFGIPQWCVSVAVQDGEGVLAGAVLDPCRGELWTARRDGQARLNGSPIGGRRNAELWEAMVATGLAYDANVRAHQAQVLAALAPAVRDIRRFGSAALDLTWTAAGRYDAYFERSVKQWDIAAGVLICERAGLAVKELPQRGPLPAGVLACTPALAPALLKLVG